MALEEIERRNYTQATAHAYVDGYPEVRRALSPLARTTRPRTHPRIPTPSLSNASSSPHSIAVEMSALRFLYNKVLRQRLFARRPAAARTFAATSLVLSRDEVARLIDAAPTSATAPS